LLSFFLADATGKTEQPTLKGGFFRGVLIPLRDALGDAAEEVAEDVGTGDDAAVVVLPVEDDVVVDH